MKLILHTLILIIVSGGVSGCMSYRIQSAGDLTLASTRNIENSIEYKQLKAYAGVSRTDIEAAKVASKKGRIKKNNPIIKEVNAYKSDNIQTAIDNVVKSVAGGEYLHNVRIYLLTSSKVQLFKTLELSVDYVVTGDVWGTNDDNPNIKGFHKNDMVVFNFTKNLQKIIGKKNFRGQIGKQYQGRILTLKGGDATIQLENSSVLDVPYSFLTNLGENSIKE